MSNLGAVKNNEAPPTAIQGVIFKENGRYNNIEHEDANVPTALKTVEYVEQLNNLLMTLHLHI